MTESQNAAMARTYAAAGWKVFPLWWTDNGRCACPNGRRDQTHPDYCGTTDDGAVKNSPGKHPITRNGVKDATTDIGDVTSWWEQHPTANIGLPAGDNGLAIIDVDPRHGGDESLANLNAHALTQGVDLTSTLAHYSGGGGIHLIFSAPVGTHARSCDDKECAGCIANGQGKPPFGPDMIGLDTRGRGGYIVAAPSVHVTGGTYQWVDFFADTAPWPDFLTAFMNPPKAPPPLPYSGPVNVGNAEKYAAKALENEIELLRSTAEGNRNNQLNSSTYYLAQLVAVDKLDESLVRRELESAALAIGLGLQAALNTIDSGFKAGLAKPRATVPRA